MTEPALRPDSVRASVAGLADRPHADVVVIGGGINGIATFRDLALQGVDVVLVERSDYCSGASAASSHMIHGGIRYLENGEFRLVRESVTERNGLLATAPHYVKPLKTTVPIFSTFSGLVAAPLRFLSHRPGKPSERGALLIKVGLSLYDSFSRDGGRVPRHEFRGRGASLSELPQLNPAVRYTATYYDASVRDPERLALDVLHDGLATGENARAANYVEAVDFHDGAVVLRDAVSGHEFGMAAKVIVNASGPWTDLTNDALGHRSAYLGGTKGSHIVLDHPGLLEACAGRELFFEHSDGRVVLIYPLNGRVLVGTTDIEVDVREPAICTEEEVDYFFELIAHVFPAIEVSRSDIVYRYAGIRPLPAHDDQQPGFVSRDYRILTQTIGEDEPVTLVSLVGGKWTTFRALAENLTDRVLTELGSTRRVETAGLAIGGGAGYPGTGAQREVWLAAHSDEIGRTRAEQLLERYGTHAASLIEALSGAPEAPLVNAPDYSRGEIEYLVRTESVVTLDDVLLRRSNLAFTGAATDALLDELADILAGSLEWSNDERVGQIERTATLLRERHGIALGSDTNLVA